jgi:hypothetical protein
MGRMAATSNPSSLKWIAESSSRLENMNSGADLKPHTAFNAGLAITGKTLASRLVAGRNGKKVGESTLHKREKHEERRSE